MVRATDQELLQQFARDRSPQPFAELFHRHGGWVRAICQRRVGDRHLAEDLSQAVFLLLMNKPEAAARSPSLGGWLFRTAQLVSAAALRSEARRARRERRAARYRALDAVVRLGDRAQKKIVREFQGHTAPVFGIAYSPDGRKLVTFARSLDQPDQPPRQDRFVRVWDAQTGAALATLANREAAVLAVAFSADGRNVRCIEGGELVTWDATSGKELSRRLVIGPPVPPIHSAAFGAAGTRLLIGGGLDDPGAAFISPLQP